MKSINNHNTLDHQYVDLSTGGDNIQEYIDNVTACGWLVIDAFPYDNVWGDHRICLHVVETPISICHDSMLDYLYTFHNTNH
jgi:hypothetical protein